MRIMNFVRIKKLLNNKKYKQLVGVIRVVRALTSDNYIRKKYLFYNNLNLCNSRILWVIREYRALLICIKINLRNQFTIKEWDQFILQLNPIRKIKIVQNNK